MVSLGVVSKGGCTIPSTSTNSVRSSSRVVSLGPLASIADDDGIRDLRACGSGMSIPDELAQCLCDDEENWSALGIRRFVGKPFVVVALNVRASFFSVAHQLIQSHDKSKHFVDQRTPTTESSSPD